MSQLGSAVFCAVTVIGSSLQICAAAGAAGNGEDFFETKIRPVLAKNCFACHTNSKMGGLQLDSRESVLKGGNRGAAVTPGRPEESLLIRAVRQNDQRLKMPPSAKLSDREIDDLAAWIKAGAVWPSSAPVPIGPVAKSGEYVIRPDQREFWSFQRVRKPAVPAVKDNSWPRNDLDRFVLSLLEDRGLRPVRPAGKRDLIRRSTFDLTGLPPTPEEVDAFVADDSPGAFAKVVDRLLASPHYGERWARYWLDYARYADEKFTRGDSRYENAYRYRDWVVQAFNDDMPYDRFVKAQIAADLLPVENREKLLPALGFYGLTSQEEDDRVDVTTRTFLALTVACARCHDHKYDPIPTKDFYSLQGVFKSTEYHEIPLAPAEVVDAYKGVSKRIKDQKSEITDFIERQSTQLADLLARKTSRYMVAAYRVLGGADARSTAAGDKLDVETLERWVKYLRLPEKEHPFLKQWEAAVARKAAPGEIEKAAVEFQSLVLTLFAEKREIDDRNYVALGGAEGAKDTKKRQYTNLESLEIKKYYLWRDLASEPYTREAVKFGGGIYYYGPKRIERWLSGEWRESLESMHVRLASLEKSLPRKYPFLHAITDSKAPENVRVEIRGEADNLGEEAPRRFLRILCEGEPKMFASGSGRLELAGAIASPDNPLTARVMVNRIFQFHLGKGIVRTVSNFGQLGDRPSHSKLLDYLAWRFVDSGWSIKSLHREIMLSATYQLSTDTAEPNFSQDPGNRLLWRANMVQRLDAESLRDAILAVSGSLELAIGGPSSDLRDDNKRRSIYGFISRNKLDPTLELFDFPNPNNTSEQRMVTVGPMQRLYFMNSTFVVAQAKALASRLDREARSDQDRIARAYQLLYGRLPSAAETRLGLEFLNGNKEAWPRYAHALLSSSEFSSVN